MLRHSRVCDLWLSRGGGEITESCFQPVQLLLKNSLVNALNKLSVHYRCATARGEISNGKQTSCVSTNGHVTCQGSITKMAKCKAASTRQFNILKLGVNEALHVRNFVFAFRNPPHPHDCVLSASGTNANRRNKLKKENNSLTETWSIEIRRGLKEGRVRTISRF